MGRENLYPRNGIWWCIYYDRNGVRRRESANTTNKKVAESHLRNLMLRAQAPKDSLEGVAPMTVASAVDYFCANVTHDKKGKKRLSEKTKDIYREKAIPVKRDSKFSVLDINHITTIDVQEYISQRENAKTQHGTLVKPHTVYKEVGLLRRAFAFLKKAGRFVGDVNEVFPFYGAEYESRNTFLTVAQYQLLRSHLPDNRSLWTDFTALAGCRLSEVQNLRWEDVDWNNRVILIRGTKTKGSKRAVPLHPHLYARLDAMRMPGTGRSGIIVQPWALVHQSLRRLCKKIGLPHISPNDLRRTFASWLVQMGVPLKVVAELMGHKTTHMVDLVYGKLDMSTLQSAVAKMPSLRNVIDVEVRVVEDEPVSPEIDTPQQSEPLLLPEPELSRFEALDID